MIQLYTSRTSQIVQHIRHFNAPCEFTPAQITSDANISCKSMKKSVCNLVSNMLNKTDSCESFADVWFVSTLIYHPHPLSMLLPQVSQTHQAHWTRFESYADVHPVIYWSGKQLYNVITHQPEKLGRLRMNPRILSIIPVTCQWGCDDLSNQDMKLGS